MSSDDTACAMTPADQAALALAVESLERVTFAGRITSVFGRQIGTVGRFVPARVSGVVTKATGAALKVALRVGLTSLGGQRRGDTRVFHRAMAAASGAAGGAFGLVSLPLELPVSTTVMLRSIADIARAEGEDLSDPDVALACLEVFALGGRSAGADLMDGGYFAVRALLAKSVSEAATYIAQKGVVDEAAPALVRLMSQIAGRFGVVVSQKLAAQATPVIGALGGAAINLAFTEHFQSLAKGHFTVRRLERAYSPELVKHEYERIAAAQGVHATRASRAAGAGPTASANA